VPLGLFHHIAPAGDPPALLVTALGRGATLAGDEYRRREDARQYDAVTALRTGAAVKGYDAAVSEAEARRVLILAAARIAAGQPTQPPATGPAPAPTASSPVLPYVAAPQPPPVAPQPPPTSSSGAGWLALGLTGVAVLAGVVVWKASGS